LEQFLGFLREKDAGEAKTEQEPAIESIDFPAIREYFSNLFGAARRTTVARKMSALKSFFSFLEKRGLIINNPAADLTAPRQEKYIPTYLPVDEMFRLLQRPDQARPLGLRDLAILEVLYSCGLRVSELVGLDIKSIDFDQRLVRVLGKGNKERIVPVGKEAVKAVRHYLEAALPLRKKTGGEAGTGPLFINARGAAFPPKCRHHRKEIWKSRGTHARHQSSCVATHLCHSSSGWGRRPKVRAGTPGP